MTSKEFDKVSFFELILLIFIVLDRKSLWTGGLEISFILATLSYSMPKFTKCFISADDSVYFCLTIIYRMKREFIDAQKSFFQRVVQKESQASAHVVLVINSISRSRSH